MSKSICSGCVNTGILNAKLVKNVVDAVEERSIDVVICSNHDISLAEATNERMQKSSGLVVNIVGAKKPAEDQ